MRSTVVSEARRKRILERLEQTGSVLSAQAASEFGVSMLTIRRDLDLLASQGLIQRVHGGAQALTREVSRAREVSGEGGALELRYTQRQSHEAEVKRRIGQQAAELVQDFETVYLDAGTTTLEVARALKLRPLTRIQVVTHAVNLAAELVGVAHIRVFCIGGEIFEESYAATGQVAVELVKRFSYDRCFIAGMGVDLTVGITNGRVPEVEVKAVAMTRAHWTCLVADASKWGVRTFAPIAPLSSVQAFVTDDRLPDLGAQAIEQLGISLYRVSHRV